MKQNKVLIMGGVIMDSYIVVDDYPLRGEDTFITKGFEKVGGCAINVATTLKNLDCKAFVVSAIGDDTKGRAIYHYLKNRGFDTSCIKTVNGGVSGYCLTILDREGERTFLTYKGCEAVFERHMVNKDLIKDIAFVYVTGYFLLDNRFHSDILETLDKLKSCGSKILFDPGPLVEHIDLDMLISVLKQTDVFVPNESEINKIKNRLNMNNTFNKWILNNGTSYILEKKGSDGVKVWTSRDSFYIPSYKVKSIDTSGAGDSFAGGLIYCLINNYSIKEAAAFSSACGAITTTFEGPHGVFTIDDITELMQNREEIL